MLIAPSRSDGAPLVVHEAMQAGVPVIGSAVGGIIDRLQGGTAGLLVPPENPERLAQAILELLSNGGRRAELQAAGRQAAAQVTYAGMLSRIEAIYAEALNQPPLAR